MSIWEQLNISKWPFICTKVLTANFPFPTSSKQAPHFFIIRSDFCTSYPGCHPVLPCGLPGGDWCPSVWLVIVSACSLLDGAAYSDLQHGPTLFFVSVPAFSPPLSPLLPNRASPHSLSMDRSYVSRWASFTSQQLFSQERFPVQYLSTGRVDVLPFSSPLPILHDFPPCVFIIWCIPIGFLFLNSLCVHGFHTHPAVSNPGGGTTSEYRFLALYCC